MGFWTGLDGLVLHDGRVRVARLALRGLAGRANGSRHGIELGILLDDFRRAIALPDARK